MFRKIVKINREKCTGCGLCVNACHEGAIGLKDGKAYLIKEDYCDGLGDCLPHCPADAITIEKAFVSEYDENAVKEHLEESGREVRKSSATLLENWPVQIKLLPVKSPVFEGAHLLIAADCTAFTYRDFMKDFMEKRVTIIGCPKLDNENYAIKLTEMLANNDIKSITIVRMEVPCCGGLQMMVKNAITASGKNIPYSVRIISTEGEIIQCI